MARARPRLLRKRMASKVVRAGSSLFSPLRRSSAASSSLPTTTATPRPARPKPRASVRVSTKGPGRCPGSFVRLGVCKIVKGARKDANALFVFDRERRLQAWRRADEPTFQRPDGYRAMLRIDRDVASGIAWRVRRSEERRVGKE